MTDTTIHPIPKGTRVNVTKFQHAAGDMCAHAKDGERADVLTVAWLGVDGDYVIGCDGSDYNLCHAAPEFVSPYVEPAEDNTPAPAEPQRVSRKQALAFIGAGYVDPSVIPDMSAQRSIINGEMPADLVSALATLGEHGLRNMGGGR